MNDIPLYLRADVQAEPLVDQWYAWSHLIPPHTAARNVTERHLRILDSYVRAPEIHAEAARNPALRGGPFVDLEGRRVDEIRELRERTAEKRSLLVALSSAIAEADAMLRERATGLSLHPLYDALPPMLRGFVELVYDLDDHASMRFLEPLLYRSEYYDRGAQSIRLSVTAGDGRPFAFSTPRLADPDAVQLDVPFDAPSVDALFRLRDEPLRWSEILDRVPVPDGAGETFRSFFTPSAPPPPPPRADAVRVRYFGHACLLVETPRANLLIDPLLSYAYAAATPRHTYADLPERIDLVVITHNHQDHLLFETLLQLRHRIGRVVVPRGGSGALQDPSMKLLLEATGFRDVVELAEMESLAFDGGELTALPFLGEHADLDIRAKFACHVRAGERSLLFAADSCNVDPALYEHVRKWIGAVDVLFLGMECDGAPLSWLYGPLRTRTLPRAADESRRLSGSDYEQALNIVEQFGCSSVYVYAMGQEPWLTHVMNVRYTEQSRPIRESNRLVAACRSRGIVAERLYAKHDIAL